jgi:hypothetical protein
MLVNLVVINQLNEPIDVDFLREGAIDIEGVPSGEFHASDRYTRASEGYLAEVKLTRTRRNLGKFPVVQSNEVNLLIVPPN